MNTIITQQRLCAGVIGVALVMTAATVSQQTAHAETKADGVVAPGTVFADCEDVCPQMVAIAPGGFVMGADAGEEGRPEGAPHRVEIGYGFALGRTEVTNAQYARFVAATGHPVSTGCRSIDAASGKVEKMPEADFRHPGPGAGEGAPQLPVVCISWTDAQAYVAWLSETTGHHYRLPTEAEWEYAARAGSSADYSWGSSADAGCAHANMLDEDGAQGGMIPVFGGQAKGEAPAIPHARCRDGHAGAAPVASYAPNAFGLYDMIGNVWEWTQDCYAAPYPQAVPSDGSAYVAPATQCPLRAVRGGSWISTPFRNRVSWRGRDPVDQVTWIFGLRVARDLPEGVPQ
ncbi:formylglycine-generating enzyme family protein [Novosphingobium sp. YJ-S2-02]|uniref:Formylglycine-generating enzyme family protein n=1 Tax=Novosphingobium aureum TaxID=2792964 RepID=A0A931HC31_9SPHN|nr:formylglycine-generating enzyme family protein [Novosphingobium aureum]MBH0113292.1 formylglycine-generating enzyme family protein [Novosphingobium aureum]